MIWAPPSLRSGRAVRSNGGRGCFHLPGRKVAPSGRPFRPANPSHPSPAITAPIPGARYAKTDFCRLKTPILLFSTTQTCYCFCTHFFLEHAGEHKDFRKCFSLPKISFFSPPICSNSSLFWGVFSENLTFFNFFLYRILLIMK